MQTPAMKRMRYRICPLYRVESPNCCDFAGRREYGTELPVRDHAPAHTRSAQLKTQPLRPVTAFAQEQNPHSRQNKRPVALKQRGSAAGNPHLSIYSRKLLLSSRSGMLRSAFAHLRNVRTHREPPYSLFAIVTTVFRSAHVVLSSVSGNSTV